MLKTIRKISFKLYKTRVLLNDNVQDCLCWALLAEIKNQSGLSILLPISVHLYGTLH